MARIYISSTYADLQDCRDQVYRALRQIGHDVVAMEDYVATDRRPLEKCLDDVGSSDIYVGIFAWRYGFIPLEDNPDQRSITELEYRHACEHEIPTLIFILDKDASWPMTFVDRGEESKKIDSLRANLTNTRTVSFFKDCENLATLVSNAVTNKVKEIEDEEDERSGGWLEKHLNRTESEFISHMSGVDRLSADQAAARYVQLLVEKKTGPDEERAPARPLSEYVARRGTKLVVFGDGGTGKTISLLRLGFDAARRAKSDPTAPIPVYTKLNFFDTRETGFDRLIEIIAASTGLHRDHVLSLWKDDARPILFLMDGFNEVGSDFQSSCALALEALLQRPQHLFVITSRPTSQVRPLIERCKLDELKFVQLNDNQLEDLLARHGAAHLYEQMESELKDLVRTPFLLWALAQSCAGLAKSELPRNKGELYQNLIDTYLFAKHEAHKEPSPTEYNYERVKKPVLASIALRMIQEGVTRKVQDLQLLREVHTQLKQIRTEYEGLIDVKPHELMPDPPSAKGIMDETVLNGVLRQVGETVEFMHQSVQDYFAAAAMLDWKADEILKLAPRSTSRRRFERSNGFEAIIMLAGLKKDTKELLNALIGHNPLLAAHCVAAASTAPRKSLETLLDQLKTMLTRQNPELRKLACACLGAARIQSEEFQRKLIDLALFDKEYDVRVSANQALAQSKSDFALNYTLNFVLSKTQTNETLKNAKEALFNIDSGAAVEMLFDEWRKAEAGGERRRQAEKLLTPLMWDKGIVEHQLYLIRVDAIRRGDTAASDSAKEALDQLDVWKQSYQKHFVSFPPASQLTKLVTDMERLKNTPSSIPLVELIENLKQESFAVGDAATEIGKRGAKESIEPLIDALYRQRIRTNINPIVHSLESIDRVRATQLLEEGLQSSDFAKQTRAAVALGLMGDFESITLVEQALKVENSAFRGSAAEVLGTCGSDEAVAALVDAVKSETNAEVLLQILFALSNTKSKSANESLLNLIVRRQSLTPLDGSLSRDEGDFVDQLVRRVVETVGANQVIAWLQDAARDQAGSVRANAINALGSIDDTDFDTRSSLREALDDPEGIVRAAAVKEIARTTNATKDIKSLFQEMVKDNDAIVRVAVLKELANREVEGVQALLIESALSDGDPYVRDAATIQLFEFAESIDQLSQVLQQQDVDQRLAAIKILRDFDRTFTLQGFKGIAIDEERKDKVFALLMDTLNDPNELVRLEGAVALRFSPHPKSRDLLVRILVDIAWHGQSVAVRQRAALELESIKGGNDALFKPISDHLNNPSEYARLIKLIGENEPFLPNHGALYAQRGSLHHQLQNFDKARADYEQALELGFDNASLRIGFAQVYGSLGQNEKALKAAEKAVEYEPGNANAHAGLGWFAYKTGDYSKSIEESRIALGLNPSLAMARFNLGLVCLASRRFDEAEAAYDAALKICNTMSAEDRKGTIEGALKDLDELLVQKPELTPDADKLKSKLRSTSTPQ
ncbi:MAG TPA: HEAT repeat domain-containing protein [Pyrinomonadaceae bacterium]|nr:HEAT repeat domain-containing protein [Pyrinomonadaceae bacterium]